MGNYKECSRCGRHFFTREDRDLFYLEGYADNEDFCLGCNAALSIVKRIKEGGSITRRDLNRLPSFLIFNPNGNDSEELAYSQQFSAIAEKLKI